MVAATTSVSSRVSHPMYGASARPDLQTMDDNGETHALRLAPETNPFRFMYRIAFCRSDNGLECSFLLPRSKIPMHPGSPRAAGGGACN